MSVKSLTLNKKKMSSKDRRWSRIEWDKPDEEILAEMYKLEEARRMAGLPPLSAPKAEPNRNPTLDVAPQPIRPASTLLDSNNNAATNQTLPLQPIKLDEPVRRASIANSTSSSSISVPSITSVDMAVQTDAEMDYMMEILNGAQQEQHRYDEIVAAREAEILQRQKQKDALHAAPPVSTVQTGENVTNFSSDLIRAFVPNISGALHDNFALLLIVLGLFGAFLHVYFYGEDYTDNF